MNGIVLINTSFKGFSPIYRRLTVGAAAQLLKTASINDVFERELNVLKLVSNRPENYEELAHVWAKIQLSRPVSVENFARQLLAAALYQPQLPQPSQPVLVLNSVKDRMVHPSCSEKIATKWRATLTRHPTAGHDLSVDDGPWVAEQITTWISQGK